MAEEGPPDPLMDIYQQAQDLVPKKVTRACDMRYEVLIKLGNILDPPDPEGNDWRIMASKLHLPNSLIDNIACKETEKTKAVLRKATQVSTKQLVKALYDMGQRDALQLLVNFYSAANCEDPEEDARGRPLRARSMDEPMESDERYPVQVRPDRALSEPVDSGYEADSCRFPRQESGEGRKGVTGGPSLTASFSSTSSLSFPRISQGSTEDYIEEEFFCEESKQFWYAVKGSSAEFKFYYHFVTGMKNSFPNDPLATQLKNNRVLKLIKHVFGIKGDKRDEVQVGRFVLLLGWFGPFKADAQGHCVCLAQIQALIDGSTTYRVGNRLESWFAGLMSQDEAGRRLRGQKRNMFLVRFSESLSEEGGFSVGLSVGEDQEPVHFNIKGNPTAAAATVPFDACLEFVPDRDPAKTYPDLVMLVNKRLTSGNPVYGDAFCVRPCPDLPLNVTFTGYEENGGRQ